VTNVPPAAPRARLQQIEQRELQRPVDRELGKIYAEINACPIEFGRVLVEAPLVLGTGHLRIDVQIASRF
jgi:hypothetical protein